MYAYLTFLLLSLLKCAAKHVHALSIYIVILLASAYITWIAHTPNILNNIAFTYLC